MNSPAPLTAGRITLLAALLLVPALAISAPAIPALSLVDSSDGGKTWSVSIQILLLMTALTLLPSLLLAATSFTRIVIVLAILRQALGMPQTPPNQILVGLSLFLTYFVMAPVIDRINADALQPYLAGTMEMTDAAAKAQVPLREFMLSQTREHRGSEESSAAGDQHVFVGKEAAHRPKRYSQRRYGPVPARDLTCRIAHWFAS